MRFVQFWKKVRCISLVIYPKFSYISTKLILCTTNAFKNTIVNFEVVLWKSEVYLAIHLIFCWEQLSVFFGVCWCSLALIKVKFQNKKSFCDGTWFLCSLTVLKFSTLFCPIFAGDFHSNGGFQWWWDERFFSKATPKAKKIKKH